MDNLAQKKQNLHKKEKEEKLDSSVTKSIRYLNT